MCRLRIKLAVCSVECKRSRLLVRNSKPNVKSFGWVATIRRINFTIWKLEGQGQAWQGGYLPPWVAENGKTRDDKVAASESISSSSASRACLRFPNAEERPLHWQIPRNMVMRHSPYHADHLINGLVLSLLERGSIRKETWSLNLRGCSATNRLG